MRQKPLSSSEIHQLVCNHSSPLGWVTPARSRTARRAASCAGAGTGGASLPIWLLTQGGGFGGVWIGLSGLVLQISAICVLEALYTQVLPVWGRFPAISGIGASMIGSVVTVISSMNAGLPSELGRRVSWVGVAVCIKLMPKIRLYS